MKTLSEEHDVVVCGGGLAGFCAALAAARHGARVALVHDRPVLGGNASSEIGVTVHGAGQFHAYARETGILSEALIEERARNHEVINENGWTNSVFDQVLYDLARRQPGLTLHLNTSLVDVLLGDDELGARNDLGRRPEPDTASGWYHRPACPPRTRIAGVVARVAQAETERVLRGKIFVDATGDALLADLAGCEWRMGAEGRDQTGEVHAPDRASTDTMGNSIHILARNIGRPAPYVPPEWARRIDDPDFFYKQGRHPSDPRGGFWWIEIGVPWHTIHDNETIRHELTAWALGIWDWIKNRDPRMREVAANYALDWIGQVPGKRESRRVMGRHLLTEHEIQANVAHPDEIAFGGWFVDLHTPGGLLADKAEPASAEGYRPDSDYAAKSYVGPYGVPLRACIAKDVDNLFLAGRCLSATHAALGTVRVMGTTALMGQAVGTAVALALREGWDADLLVRNVSRVQQALLRDGCYLPHVAPADPADLARGASASASSEAQSRGAGPDDAWCDGGLGRAPDDAGFSLVKLAAQWIAVAGGRVDELSVCLDHAGPVPARVRARLVRVEHIWDYRRDLPALAETVFDAPVGEKRWVTWPVALSGVPDGYLRLELVAENPAEAPLWRHARPVLPGQVAAWAMSAKKLRRLGNGSTLAFRVSPAQPVYAAANAITGRARPHAAPHLWRSDAGEPMPQWLALEWETPRRVAQVELTFPGHLLREYHAGPPFFRDPQTARDYTLEAWLNGAWREVLRVTGNYQRHRRHRLPELVETSRLRVVVQASNGDPSAAIYELRVYA
jgi:hypothetical protein